MSKQSLVLILAVIFSCSGMLAAESSDSGIRIGLTALISDPHLDLLIPINFGDDFSIAPAFGIASVEDIGTDISLGCLFRKHWKQKKYSRFIGLGIAALRYSPDEKNEFQSSSGAQTDLLLSPHLGIERYFDSKFCIGISAQINMISVDKNSFRLGYPDKKVKNTATSLYISLFL